MKRLLFIFTFLCFGFAFAQFAEAPQYQFNSTSSYKYTEIDRQYTVPVSEVQQPFSYSPQRSVIRREPVRPPADPGWENVPIGDPDFYLITALLFSYFYMKKRRQHFLLYTGI